MASAVITIGNTRVTGGRVAVCLLQELEIIAAAGIGYQTSLHTVVDYKYTFTSTNRPPCINSTNDCINCVMALMFC